MLLCSVLSLLLAYSVTNIFCLQRNEFKANCRTLSSTLEYFCTHFKTEYVKLYTPEDVNRSIEEPQLVVRQCMTYGPCLYTSKVLCCDSRNKTSVCVGEDVVSDAGYQTSQANEWKTSVYMKTYEKRRFLHE